jgi:hypothetical protein
MNNVKKIRASKNLKKSGQQRWKKLRRQGVNKLWQQKVKKKNLSSKEEHKNSISKECINNDSKVKKDLKG